MHTPELLSLGFLLIGSVLMLLDRPSRVSNPAAGFRPSRKVREGKSIHLQWAVITRADTTPGPGGATSVGNASVSHIFSFFL